MSKKDIEKAVADSVPAMTQGIIATVGEVAKDMAQAKNDPMSQLASMSKEYQTVIAKIFRVDEKNPGRPALFTMVPDLSLSDMGALDPPVLCKYEGGGGLWNIIFVSPDSKGKAIAINGIRTEGRHQAIGTTEAKRDGVDKYTGQPIAAGGMSALPIVTASPAQSATEIAKMVAETASSAAEREAKRSEATAATMAATAARTDSVLGNVVALMIQQQQTAQQQMMSQHAQQPVASEETKLLRTMIEGLNSKLQYMQEQQAKAEADTKFSLLTAEIKALNEKLSETKKGSEISRLEARLAELAQPKVDPMVNVLTTILGTSREDAKANTTMLLEILRNQPDATDRFAKVQDMLMNSTMAQINMMQQLAAAQGGPQSPAVEIAKMVAQTAAEFFGSRGGGDDEEEEVEAETAESPALSGITPKQLAAAAPDAADTEEETAEKETPEDTEEETEENAMEELTPEKIHAEIAAQIAKWDAGEAIPEQDEEGRPLLLSEKDLNAAMATSSIDTAIRLLASRKKPVPEVTARLLTLAMANHRIAQHWFQHPLPATYQILRHWDKQPGNTGATKRIADLVTDIIAQWAWMEDKDEHGEPVNDIYGRSSYRPPAAVKGVEERTHGVTTQGKVVKTAFGVKQEVEATGGGEER